MALTLAKYHIATKMFIQMIKSEFAEVLISKNAYFKVHMDFK